jgi:hypothetical protein
MKCVRSETPGTGGDLKQKFENALTELETAKVSEVNLRQRTPIVRRNRKLQTSADVKKEALLVAATSLAALWGL